jgi:hypothetical protein
MQRQGPFRTGRWRTSQAALCSHLSSQVALLLQVEALVLAVDCLGSTVRRDPSDAGYNSQSRTAGCTGPLDADLRETRALG